MIKAFFFIFLIFFHINLSFAKNININENLNIKFICELKKKIIKNSEYNYKIFLAEDLDEDNLDSFKIYANQPSTLIVNGLSDFFSQNSNFDVRIVNNDVVLFKAVDQEKNYTESGILNRKSGELVHEITRNVNSGNSEKDISFYSCRKIDVNG
tara:strand:- start:1295 stop:1756 length:462 start_codon:yes stop_codon:yes gene_type:complete